MKKLKFKLSGIAIVVAILFSLIPLSVGAVQGVYTSTLSSSYLYAGDPVYNTAWTAANGIASDNYYQSFIGQKLDGGNYTIYRSYLYFDTSSLPTDATINSASVFIYGLFDFSTVDFNITLYTGTTTTHPHDPLVVGDYDKTNYSGNVCGNFNTALFTVLSWNEIPLTQNGIGNIIVGGTTKFTVRSDNEVAGIAPVGNDLIIIRNISGDKTPYMVINYTSSGNSYVDIVDVKVYQGYDVPTSGMSVADHTGTMTGSPVTIQLGNNTPTVTAAGTFTLTVPTGTTAVVTSDGWTVTDSPKTITSTGDFTVQGGGAGNITIAFYTDYLIVAEVYNKFFGYYPNKAPNEYFNIQLLQSSANTTILAVTPLKQWGLRPEAIYISSAVAATLTENSLYVLRIKGLFTGAPSPPTDYTLSVADWQGSDLNKLDDWLIGVAWDMQQEDAVAYLTALTDQGIVINDTAGGYFVTGIPKISTIRPDAFSTSSTSPDFTQGTDANVWDKTDADLVSGWRSYVGTTISGMIDNVATPFGVSGKNMAAGIIMLGMLLCVFWVVSNGAGALGAVLIYVPMLWLGTYFRILPTSILLIMTVLFGFFWIRQFITKTT